MKVVVAGHRGFIGKNLLCALGEFDNLDVKVIDRGASRDKIISKVAHADVVFHMAGANRPLDASSYERDNINFTRELCDCISIAPGSPLVVYASSSKAEQNTAYGCSKLGAEHALMSAADNEGLRIRIYRLPNIFGKWCRPNYNSFVATFCHNISRDKAININEKSATVTLLHIDKVVNEFMRLLSLDLKQEREVFYEIEGYHVTTVGEVAEFLLHIHESRNKRWVPKTGLGLERELYSTFISYLPKDRFVYCVPLHKDKRGEFSEIVKTDDHGQFSYFTASPGEQRGSHYHHTKTEKFIVIRGRALFEFRDLGTGDTWMRVCDGGSGEVVESIPGWVHSVTNIGEQELIVGLWANESFDAQRPDTFSASVNV